MPVDSSIPATFDSPGREPGFHIIGKVWNRGGLVVLVIGNCCPANEDTCRRTAPASTPSRTTSQAQGAAAQGPGADGGHLHRFQCICPDAFSPKERANYFTPCAYPATATQTGCPERNQPESRGFLLTFREVELRFRAC